MLLRRPGCMKLSCPSGHGHVTEPENTGHSKSQLLPDHGHDVLADARRAAHEYLEKGHARGKVILKVQ